MENKVLSNGSQKQNFKNITVQILMLKYGLQNHLLQIMKDIVVTTDKLILSPQTIFYRNGYIYQQ